MRQDYPNVMNTAFKIYPNTSFDLLVRQQAYSIFWEADSDQILVQRTEAETRRTKSSILDPNKLDFVTDPEYGRADATYSVNVENNQLRLKYMDGHRFQSVIVE